MANVYNISSDKSFLDVLGISLLEEVNFDSNKLQEYIILLPTRRACSSLRDVFLKNSHNKALILPTIQPIGDAFDYDDLFWLDNNFEIEPEKPPISSIKRLFILSNLVMEKAKAQGINMSPHTTYILSKELAGLIDEVAIENLSWDNLKNIIPENLNTYWQEILTFLEIVTKVYPEYLKNNELSDIKEYQLIKLKKLIKIWETNPPNRKIIAAGNTATQPIIAELLKVIANLNNGSVILPGIDMTSSDEDFHLFNEGHYQYGLKRLLDNIGITRKDIKEWGVKNTEPTINNERLKLLIETLKPADLTQNWRYIPEFSDEVLKDVYKLECKDEREEALSIALIMREVLETPEKTASLVTTDVNLGKRVSLELERFGIKINNSAGLSLSQTPIGIFFNLILEFCINPSPIYLLSLLKHPLCGAGFGEECRNIARKLEKELQGKNKVYSIEELKESIEDKELQNYFLKIVSLANPLLEIKEKEISLIELITKHIDVAQKMAINEDILWQGPSGKVNSEICNQIIQDGEDFFKITLEDYAKLFLQFQTALVRNPYNTHKRLEILGPMEARLQQKDVIILGSLNEGMFPKTEEAGPWMSHQMRCDFGLPSVKQKFGISASDFCNGFMAKEVYLTRSLKSEGTPTIASRWLQRLEAVIDVAASKAVEKSKWNDKSKWIYYSERLDKPDSYNPIEPVSANPDLNSRPKKISMSAVESLIKDPYGFYAKYILKLKPTPEIEPIIGASDYGSAVHYIINRFTTTYKEMPKDSHEIINQKAKEYFKEKGISLFWLTRFNRASKWLIEELQTIKNSTKSYSEIEGVMEIEDITITARADRIDINSDKKAVIIDYKTGNPPTFTEVIKGFSPQLVIEALIAEKGGFTGLSKTQTEKILYYCLSGKDENPDIIDITKGIEVDELLNNTEKGLKRLIKAFYKDVIPYDARPNLAHKNPYSDYEHLERVKEWASNEGDDK